VGEVLNLERGVLLWRTRMGRKTAVRYLDVLSVALRPKGWRFIKLYRPAPTPLLRVYACGPEEIGIMVSVLAVPGGAWGYHEAPRGRRGIPRPLRRREGRGGGGGRPPQTPHVPVHLVSRGPVA
jgi:hypothetical protein